MGKFTNTSSSLIPLFLLGACTQTEQAPPNIIMILADDLGYGDLSCYGSDSIHTPNIDQMAEEGLRFNRFYTNASVSTPTRAGLLTGRYQIRSDMAHIEAPWVNKGLPPEELTIAEMLRGEGYHTGLIGKWHLGHKKGSTPNCQGFDYFFCLLFSNDQNVAIHSGYGHKLKEEDLLALRRDSIIIDQEVYQNTLTQRYAAESYNFIAKNRDNPFFLYIAHWAPHEPLHVSKEYEGSSKYGLYGDVVQEMDAAVGVVFDALKEFGLDDNTLVIFTSDNGARVLPQRFMNNEPCGSTGGLNGYKTTVFEGGIRVPAIAWWKKKIAPGQETDAAANTIDIWPTIAGITQAQIPDSILIDGKDISDILFNKGTREHEDFFYYRLDKLQAINSGYWKLHLPFDDPKAKPGKPSPYSHEDTLLFNLEDDMYEQHNLYHERPDVVEMLIQKGDDFLKTLD